MYEITFRDVTTKYYPITNIFRESSSREEIGGIQDWLFFSLMNQKFSKKPLFYISLRSLFEIDSSSVYPRFTPINKTSLIKEPYKETPSEEILEYDIFVRMTPIKKYTIRIKVKNVKKATPRIVEPEGF